MLVEPALQGLALREKLEGLNDLFQLRHRLNEGPLGRLLAPDVNGRRSGQLLPSLEGSCSALQFAQGLTENGH